MNYLLLFCYLHVLHQRKSHLPRRGIGVKDQRPNQGDLIVTLYLPPVSPLFLHSVYILSFYVFLNRWFCWIIIKRSRVPDRQLKRWIDSVNSSESSHFHRITRSYSTNGIPWQRTSPLYLCTDSDVEKRSDFGATKQHARASDKEIWILRSSTIS